MKFEITKEDRAKIDKWLMTEVYPVIIEEQKQTDMVRNEAAKACWEDGYPYTGAIGGGLTYCFSPTSIGMSFVVTFLDRFKLDLTDYDSW